MRNIIARIVSGAVLAGCASVATAPVARAATCMDVLLSTLSGMHLMPSIHGTSAAIACDNGFVYPIDNALVQ